MSQSIADGNYLSAKIGSNSIRILIDSGSVQNLISLKLVQRLNLEVQPLLSGDLRWLFAAEGSRLKVNSFVEVNFNFSGLIIACRLLVIHNLSESVLVGTDFLKEKRVILDYPTGSATIFGDLLTVPLFNANKKQYLVRVPKSTFYLLSQRT